MGVVNTFQCNMWRECKNKLQSWFQLWRDNISLRNAYKSSNQGWVARSGEPVGKKCQRQYMGPAHQKVQ